MSQSSENNKRIAKNTLLLYVRTLFTMLISLFTSRVVLNTLGVTDYGINNVVGGVITMLGFLTGSLSSASSRFITFELGRGNMAVMKRTFGNIITIHFALAGLVLAVGETVGLWFVSTQLNIPAERATAASWVYQFSVLSAILGVISVPYNAAIIAHERMKAFAYIGIIDAVLKLAIVYMLLIIPFDKLIVYSFLFFCIQVFDRVVYGVYCTRHFEETCVRFCFDKKQFCEMMSFAGWSFFGNGAYMLNTQGVNMLINIFFGVALNAARGIASQVQGAVMQFVNNFTVAVNPQITKSYATGDMDYVYKLVCRGARFSYFLLLIFVVPITCEADYILKLWLKIVPDHAPAFLCLSLFGALMDLLSKSILTAVSATGNIKRYQIGVTVVGGLIFPLTWIAFKLGYPAESTYVILIIIYFFQNFVRLYFAKVQLRFPVKLYIFDVMLRTAVVTALSFILPLIIVWNMESGFMRLCITCIVSVISTSAVISTCGLEKSERAKIFGKVVAITSRFKR